MRFINIGTFAILATLGLGTASAQTLYTCGEGPVLNVQMITEMVAQPPVVHTIDPLGEPQQLIEPAPNEPRQAVLVTVQLFNVIYAGEAFAADADNFDATELQPDEMIATCVTRDHLILDRADGRQFRARIVRVERLRRPLGTR
jgi:hypothetical protein